jgi:phosphoglycolate phosphatase
MPLTRLVLFDIDGTLLMPDGAGKASLVAALEQVYGTPGDAANYNLGGSLDRETVRILMSAAGIEEAIIWQRFEDVGRAMESSLRERISANLHNVQPVPGAPELVAALHMHDEVLLGLVTGNFRATALVKLEAAGYDPTLFQIGAFGHEAENRGDLPPLAVRRAKELSGIDFRGQQVVIIGDTTSDIRCGHGIGARSIALATGWVSREELAKAGPDYLFDDLADMEAVLRAIFAPED